MLLKFNMQSTESCMLLGQKKECAVEKKQLNQESVIKQKRSTGGVWFFCPGTTKFHLMGENDHEDTNTD